MALEWAARCPSAATGSVEVRAASALTEAGDPEEGLRLLDALPADAVIDYQAY